ncbi:hypothetical protein BB561_000622 [Smittium simulii]|uniref:Deacetylase sirtuin-type domain-containing protein n=1 Tax=Smittium simulii TaxID=133385 RepID=A0A2T9YY84_9FUNG|nr:hypothetical protein BB561_000622 [Smittium simulii]
MKNQKNISSNCSQSDLDEVTELFANKLEISELNQNENKENKVESVTQVNSSLCLEQENKAESATYSNSSLCLEQEKQNKVESVTHVNSSLCLEQENKAESATNSNSSLCLEQEKENRADEAEQIASSEKKSEELPESDKIADSIKVLSTKENIVSEKKKIYDTESLKAITDIILSGKAKNIIILTGAGISTSSGIPDFRSPNTGLYDNLQQFDLPYAEAIFDIEFFETNPKPFYTLAKELYPGNFSPTLSHAFIKMVADNGLLLRNYTQNIDTLERIAGLDSKYIIEAHGSFYKAHCINKKCNSEYSQEWVKEMIDADTIPKCKKCKEYVKPDITFFGEQLPANFYQSIRKDFLKCDLLIVMGTSLQVYPFASLVNKTGLKAKRLLINREKVGETISGEVGLEFGNKRDYLFLGDSDDACYELIKLLGWYDQLNKSYKPILENYRSRI